MIEIDPDVVDVGIVVRLGRICNRWRRSGFDVLLDEAHAVQAVRRRSGGDIGLCSRQFQLARVRQPVCDVGHHVGEPTDREVVAADATPMQAVGHAEWGVVVGDHQ